MSAKKIVVDETQAATGVDVISQLAALPADQQLAYVQANYPPDQALGILMSVNQRKQTTSVPEPPAALPSAPVLNLGPRPEPKAKEADPSIKKYIIARDQEGEAILAVVHTEGKVRGCVALQFPGDWKPTVAMSPRKWAKIMACGAVFQGFLETHKAQIDSYRAK